MRLLVRCWNVFHGRTVPEGDRLHLEDAIRLIAGGEPDVVCLQELPAWSLSHLAAWSGMGVFGSLAMPPLGGPLARRLTDLAPRTLRSALTGQANALLFSRRLEPGERTTIELNPSWFRRREAARAALSREAERAWRRNRRVAQVIRLRSGAGTAVVANVHLTSPADCRAANLELLRATDACERLGPDEPHVLCGDFNLTARKSPALAELARRGYSAPGPGIDHILARGLQLAGEPHTWPDDRRRLGSRLLSDHAPLEAEMIWP